MYGAILGDIIGSPYEFDMGDKSKAFPLFCGDSEFTDDSVMTIAVAEALLDADTAAVFVNHCSNVTGAVQDVRSLAEIAHRHGALLVLDAAQSAGCIPVKADVWGVDALIFTGHKALFGPQGTGGYYVRAGVPFSPYRYGGTGRDSRRLSYDGADDYEFEPGTRNLPGIAALSPGAA